MVKIVIYTDWLKVSAQDFDVNLNANFIFKIIIEMFVLVALTLFFDCP